MIELVDRPIPEPGEGEVRIRIFVSGVNPTDWKFRSGATGTGGLARETVPNHDGAGGVDKLGPGGDRFRVGDKVWVTLAAHERLPLPPEARFDLGASIPILGITAHRALTVAEDGPTRLHPNALNGRTVLVAGGAGAVGNAAIQLARWAGARLADAAGAHQVVNYEEADVAGEIRRVAPGGVELVVEVAAGSNADLDLAVLKPRGTTSIYVNNGGVPLNFDIGRSIGLNARYQFALLYTVGSDRIVAAAEDINAAITDGTVGVGEQCGLPLHHFTLGNTADAHAAAEKGSHRQGAHQGCRRVGTILRDAPQVYRKRRRVTVQLKVGVENSGDN